MNRAEHMTWCKERAHEYLAQGDLGQALASMTSDLSKHPETKAAGEMMAPMGLMAAMSGNVNEVRRFIDGFN